MMSQDLRQRIAALLSETEAAHGRYEERELNGVYDQNWADWYAAYLVQHGLAELLGSALTAGQVSQLLKQYDADYKRDQPGEGWSAYVAQQLVAQ